MIALALFFVAAARGDVLDQSQSLVDTNTGPNAIGGSSDQELAQVVTAGLSGSLTAVGLPVAGSGTLLVQIEGVSGGIPNGTVLTSQTVAGSSLPDFATDPTGFRFLELSQPVNFLAGDLYAIVLSALSPPSDSFGLLNGPLGNPYPGGDAVFSGLINPGTWYPLGNGRFDLPFESFVMPAPEPSASVFWGLTGLVIAMLRAATQKSKRKS